MHASIAHAHTHAHAHEWRRAHSSTHTSTVRTVSRYRANVHEHISHDPLDIVWLSIHWLRSIRVPWE